MNCSDICGKQDTYVVFLHRSGKKLLKPSSAQQSHSASCHSPPCAGLVHMLCLQLERLHPILCMAPHIQSSACYVFRGDLPGHASVKLSPYTFTVCLCSSFISFLKLVTLCDPCTESLVFVSLLPPSSLITSETQAIQPPAPTSVLGQNKNPANIGCLKTVFKKKKGVRGGKDGSIGKVPGRQARGPEPEFLALM